MSQIISVEEVLQREQRLRVLRARHHESCAVCSVHQQAGLRASFSVCVDGSVEASVVCGAEKEGYAGMVHGGILATLLDGAMTNCLFSLGTVAVTGEFTMKILQAVASGTPVRTRAWLLEDQHPLYLVAGELWQGGRVVATGHSKFMEISYLKR